MGTFCQRLALNDTKHCLLEHRREIQAFLLEQNVKYEMPECFGCTVGFIKWATATKMPFPTKKSVNTFRFLYSTDAIFFYCWVS